MKENKKKVSILVEEGDKSEESFGYDEKKSISQRLIKPLIFILMGIVFLGCMILIFKPSSEKEEIQNTGLNDSVPQPSEAALQADKQKAYEQEIQQEKEQQKRKALTSLSDYWNEHSSENDQNAPSADEDLQNGNSSKSGSPAVNSYRNAQNTLGSFYQNDNSETQDLRRQLDEMRQKLAEKDIPSGVTTADQLVLMEKSYQMAAKYLPTSTGTNEASGKTVTTSALTLTKRTADFSAFTPAVKNTVSALYRETSHSTYFHNLRDLNSGFYTSGLEKQTDQSKNSIKACVVETQTIIGEGSVRVRLLEPAKTQSRIVPIGAILTASAKIQTGRLQLKITSIEMDGNIIPVDITIYDLDGQPGLRIPYSAEINTLNEIAGNMSQTSGTSLMMTQSAGQQVAADLSRGVVQGISGYFSKKVKAQKVTIKAGHQLFLVAKK